MSSGVALSVKDLARLHGVSERIARMAIARCAAGKTWRGLRLQAVEIVGPGGSRGWRYAVPLDSLPADWQARYWELKGGKPPAVEPAQIEPPADWMSDIGKKAVHFGERERQRLRLAGEVVETTLPRSRERSQVMDEEYARLRLAPQRTARVLAGGAFSLDGETYVCEAASRSGIGEVTIAAPVFGDRSALAVFSGKKFLGVAELVRPLPWNDRAGIAEQRKCGSGQRRQYRTLNGHLAPVLRLENRIKAHGPIPHARSASVVLLDAEVRLAAQKMKAVRSVHSAQAEEQAADPLEQEAARRKRAYGNWL